MAVPYCVVTAMKNRADDNALEQPAVRQACIDVLDALHEVADGDQHHKLIGLHTDKQRDRRKERSLNDIVEKVVAVIVPQRHLLLAVMHRMQFPPHAETMLPAVIPVAGKIEQDQVDQE